jgi:PST family polysaccharide transporter
VAGGQGNDESDAVTVHFDDNVMTEGHGRKSLRGGALTIGARALNAFIQIGSVLFLARLLSPEDYGLVSMVTAITGFASVFVDLGTRDAIVQRTRITRGEVSALFWITLGVGTVSAMLVALSGPVIARFYGEPRLVMIAVVSSLTFVTTALHCQPYALLRRAMQFREIGAIEVAANVISAGAAIAMAYSGFGYWALVLRPLTMTALIAIGVWAVCRWVPSRPTVTGGVKDMLKFGLNLTGFTMTDFAGRSGDRVAVGYRGGAAGLGHYQNARFIYDNLLDVLVIPVHGVAIASLSKLRDNLPELKRLWSKALSILAFYAMPAFGILAVTSQDVIVLLLSSKWASSGTLLSILALRGIPHSVERTLGWLHVAADRSDRWMRWGVFATVAQFLALFCGLPFGPIGIAVAYVASTFILFVPAIEYAGRPLGIGARDVVAAVGRQMTGAVAAAGVGFLLRFTVFADMGSLERTLALTVAYTVVYLGIVVGVFGVWTPITLALSLLRTAVPVRVAQPVAEA